MSEEIALADANLAEIARLRAATARQARENRALREALQSCEEYLALRPAETPAIRALVERIREVLS